MTLREEVPLEPVCGCERTWCGVEREREREREPERERETRREREREREREGGGGEPCAWVRDSNKVKKKRETKENNERQNSKMYAVESFPNLLQRAGGASMKKCVWPRCKILSCSGGGRCSAEAKFLQPCDPGLNRAWSLYPDQFFWLLIGPCHGNQHETCANSLSLSQNWDRISVGRNPKKSECRLNSGSVT